MLELSVTSRLRVGGLKEQQCVVGALAVVICVYIIVVQ